MKIQHYAIVFIIIILPYSIVCRGLLNERIDSMNMEMQINNALDVATTDAVDTLIDLNNEYYALYEGEAMEITPTIAKEAMKVFFQSLSLNNNLPFVSGDTLGEEYFSAYIPAVVLVGYDGFYIYSIEKIGPNETYSYVLSPKIPYSYYDPATRCYINFSLRKLYKTLCIKWNVI